MNGNGQNEETTQDSNMELYIYGWDEETTQ